MRRRRSLRCVAAILAVTAAVLAVPAAAAAHRMQTPPACTDTAGPPCSGGAVSPLVGAPPPALSTPAPGTVGAQPGPGVTVGQPPAAAGPPAGNTVCDALWWISNTCNAVVSTIGAVPAAIGSAAQDAASKLAQTAVKGTLDGIWYALCDAASSVLDSLLDVVQGSTAVNLNRPWLLSRYSVTLSIGIMLTALMLLFGIIWCVVHQRPGMIGQIIFIRTPLAMVAMFGVLTLTQLALSLVDSLTEFFFKGTGVGGMESLPDSAAKMMTSIRVVTLHGGTPDHGLVFWIIVLGFLLIGLFGLYIELLVRSASIYLTVLFAPLALAGNVWPQAASWAKRLGWTLFGLIIAKFLLIGSLSLGFAAIGDAAALGQGSLSAGGLADVLKGAAILFLTAVGMPWFLFKLLRPLSHGRDTPDKEDTPAGDTTEVSSHAQYMQSSGGGGGTLQLAGGSRGELAGTSAGGGAGGGPSSLGSGPSGGGLEVAGSGAGAGGSGAAGGGGGAAAGGAAAAGVAAAVAVPVVASAAAAKGGAGQGRALVESARGGGE